jgi:hypothetical protein
MFPSYVSQYLPTYIGSCRQGSVMWTLEVVESFLQFSIFGFNQDSHLLRTTFKRSSIPKKLFICKLPNITMKSKFVHIHKMFILSDAYSYLFKGWIFPSAHKFLKKKWFWPEILVSGLHKISKYILGPCFTTQIKPLSALMKLSYSPKGVLNRDIRPTGLYSFTYSLGFTLSHILWFVILMSILDSLAIMDELGVWESCCCQLTWLMNCFGPTHHIFEEVNSHYTSLIGPWVGFTSPPPNIQCCMYSPICTFPTKPCIFKACIFQVVKLTRK